MSIIRDRNSARHDLHLACVWVCAHVDIQSVRGGERAAFLDFGLLPEKYLFAKWSFVGDEGVSTLSKEADGPRGLCDP